MAVGVQASLTFYGPPTVSTGRTSASSRLFTVLSLQKLCFEDFDSKPYGSKTLPHKYGGVGLPGTPNLRLNHSNRQLSPNPLTGPGHGSVPQNRPIGREHNGVPAVQHRQR